MANYTSHASDKLVAVLQHYSIAPPPGIKIGDPTIQGVRKIATILKTMYSMPSPSQPQPTPTIPICPSPIALPLPPPPILLPLTTQIPEEKIYEYYIKLNTPRKQAAVLLPVPRVQGNIIPPLAAALRVKKTKRLLPSLAQDNIDDSNDIIA